jgi:putative hemolysin
MASNRALGRRGAFDYMSDLLDLKVSTLNLERIPATGRCIIVCNHPTGIADGIAVYDAIKARRSDAIFFANADALRVSPRLGEIVIPVEWVVEKRTREKTRATLDAARAAFEGERCVVMFPAGRLARVGKDGSVTDPEWAPTAASMARKYNAPVVPIHVAGPYLDPVPLFDKVSQELRDITLFHELLNKRKKAFQLKVGLPIPPTRLDIDAGRATYAEGLHRAGPAQPAGRGVRVSDGTIILSDADATTALGARIAPLLQPGDAVLLYGPLGMGKSTLARGLIRALTGPDEDVPSPTFTLVQFYETTPPVAHFDLYR